MAENRHESIDLDAIREEIKHLVGLVRMVKRPDEDLLRYLEICLGVRILLDGEESMPGIEKAVAEYELGDLLEFVIVNQLPISWSIYPELSKVKAIREAVVQVKS